MRAASHSEDVDVARDSQVELAVADRRRVLDRLRELQHPGALVDVGAVGSQAHGLLLQRGSRLQQLKLPRMGHLEDDDRRAGPDRHEAVAREALQRFANRRAADAGPPRQILFGHR